MPIDTTRPLYATHRDDPSEQIAVKILSTLPDEEGSSYPIYAIVEDGDDVDDHAMVRFSTEGRSRKGTYTLHNEANSRDNVDETAIALPEHLRYRVRHATRGPGTVIKVRKHDTRSVLVKFDNYDADSVWSRDRKLTPIAA